jgi:hypothetical protein
MPVILTTGRLRHQDHKFEVTLGYVVRPCLKNKKTKDPKQQQQKTGEGYIGQMLKWESIVAQG